MKTMPIFLSLLLGSLLMVPALAAENTPEDVQALKEKWRGMTPDEKREAWQTLPDEKKQMIRERLQQRKDRPMSGDRALREKLRDMTPEERRTYLQNMSEEEKAKLRQRPQQPHPDRPAVNKGVAA